MSWRVALIDTCGRHPKAQASAAFFSEAGRVRQSDSDGDASGHGTRVAEILTCDTSNWSLILAQVFAGRIPASAAAVAAAIEWSVAQGANLLHLSLGLAADRPALAEAVKNAVAQGVLVVASSPARGGRVFPAAYPQVIGATGDARCAAGELSHLGPSRFGGCPRSLGVGLGDLNKIGGASMGAAWVSRAILEQPGPVDRANCLSFLIAQARYRGAERRTPAAECYSGPTHSRA